MKLRHLFLLIGIQVLTSSEVLQSQIQAQPSTKPMPTGNLEDSLSLVKKKKVKEKAGI